VKAKTDHTIVFARLNVSYVGTWKLRQITLLCLYVCMWATLVRES